MKDQSKISHEPLNIDLIAHPDIVNPFTEITRRARKFLLLTSFIGFTITWAGFVPNKIEALGITLTEVNKNAILILIIMTLVYFISAFWIYANTDLIRYSILRRAGTDNIKNTSGKRLLEYQEALKAYEFWLKEKKLDNPYKTGLKLPKPPSEVFKAAEIQEQIKEPMLLYKYSKAKVIFDKYFPILTGLTCLLFVILKLFSLEYSDTQLIYASLSSLALIFLILSLIFKFQKFKEKYSWVLNKTINTYNLANNWFIKQQQIMYKPGSKRFQKLHNLRHKLAKENIRKMLDREKKRFKKTIG